MIFDIYRGNTATSVGESMYWVQIWFVSGVLRRPSTNRFLTAGPMITKDGTCGSRSGGMFTCQGSKYGNCCSYNGFWYVFNPSLHHDTDPLPAAASPDTATADASPATALATPGIPAAALSSQTMDSAATSTIKPVRGRGTVTAAPSMAIGK